MVIFNFARESSQKSVLLLVYFCFIASLFTPLFLQVLDLQLGLGDYDVDYLTAKEDYCARWDAVDTESGTLKNEISICSEVNKNDCLLCSLDVGNQTSICIADLELKEGVKYVTKIHTVNNVGLSTDLLSDGFVVDTTPLLMGDVIFIDNPRKIEDESAETFTHSQIAVQWNGFWDKESGVRNYYICVGTQPGECNIKNFTDARNSTSYSFQDLPLVQGERCFVSIKAENKAGLTSDVKTSDAVVVDKTGKLSTI